MESALTATSSILDEVDVLCVPSTEMSKKLHQSLQDLFDLSVKLIPEVELGPLVELFIKNMDSESIWEQLQSRNRPLNRYVEQNAKKLYHSVVPSTEERIKSSDKYQSQVEDEDDIAESDSLHSDHNSDDGETDDSGEEQCDRFDIASDDGDDDSGEDEQSESEEMESWLDLMDEAESVRLERLHREPDESQDNIDQDDDNEDDDEDDEAFVQRELYALDSDGSADGDDDDNSDYDDVNARFNDFFASSKHTNKVSKSNLQSRRSNVHVRDDMDFEEKEEEDDINDDDSDDDDSAEEDKEDDMVTETSYSRKKRALMEQIALLEDNAIGAKSWEVVGEVKSSQRPENSLLGIPVDVERSSKVTPVINQEYLKTLEDMIIQRIKDSKFDNWVHDAGAGRKNEHIAGGLEDVSQEKSKLGLGEIYAEQFLKQSANFDANALKQENEVNAMVAHFQKVCRQLDALSHFQFAPKPVGTSADSSSMAVQSIALEDVAPITMLAGAVGGGSSAQAPEQSVGKKRGLDAQFIGGDEEITRSNRQKMRRKQKKKQNINGNSVASNVVSEENDKYLDLKNDSRVIQKNSEKSTGKSEYSKSSEFFSRLQEEVNSGIKKRRIHNQDNTSSSGQQVKHSNRMKL